MRGRLAESDVTTERNSLCKSGIVMAALAMAGCTSAVVVETEFPTPLVNTLPVSVGLYYEPKLRDFIHAEALPRSSTWTIDLGDANLAMLDPLYDTLFADTREIDELPPSPVNAGLDGILASTIEEYQFDVPRSTRDEFVEVWLKYRLELLRPDGNVVVEWEAIGYGKAEIDGKREDAVQRASIVAMREAGARISTEFAEQQPVIDWVEDVINGRI